MGIFYVLLLVPLLIQHVSIKGYYIDYNKRNKLALKVFFVLITVLVMFRHESVGNDTGTYILYFREFTRMGWFDLDKMDLEIGYAIFNKAVSVITKQPQMFLAIAAVTVAAMIYPTYHRLSEDTALTIVLFCIMSIFPMMFSGIRQMIAIGLGCIAYDFVREKRIVPFVVTVLLAISFHVSAFMLIFMYPLYHAKIRKKQLYWIAPGIAVVFALNEPIFSFLTAILARFTRFEAGMESTGAYTLLILFVLFTVFSFLIPDNSSLDEETVGLRNFLLISLIIQMFAPLHTLAMRLNYYYIIFIPLLLPKIIQYRSKRWNQVAILGRHIMVLFFLVYFFMNATPGSNLRVFPYHFFWENVG